MTHHLPTRLALAAGLLFATAAAQAAPRDLSRHSVCASFARYAVQWDGKAKSMGCRLDGRNYGRPEGFRYEWCMGTSDASFRVRSPQALGYKDALQKACGRQLKRPFAL
jgi:hypothetical protein